MSYAPNTPYPGAFAVPVEPRRRSRSTLGTAALLLALIALSLAWVPVLGLVMLVPGTLAVLLGIVGFTKAAVDGKTRRGLPFVATSLGLLSVFLAPVSTMVGAILVVPLGLTVAADQAQVELEHELTRGGMTNDEAERIGTEIGDALRAFAKPGNWRDGISAAHRFGLIVEDYEGQSRQIDDGDIAAQAALLADLKADLASLANRYGVNLTADDLDKLVTALHKHHERERAEWERRQKYGRNGVIITLDRGHYDERFLIDGCHD